jgi:hypothetical protein
VIQQAEVAQLVEQPIRNPAILIPIRWFQLVTVG